MKCKREAPLGWYCTRETHIDPYGEDVNGSCALAPRWYNRFSLSQRFLMWLRGGH